MLLCKDCYYFGKFECEYYDSHCNHINFDEYEVEEPCRDFQHWQEVEELKELMAEEEEYIEYALEEEREW